MSEEDSRLPTPLVPDMIHRPEEPRHMMRIKPLDRVVTVRLGDEVIAKSDDALQMIEIGKDVYDPVYYLPMADVRAELRQTDKSTHCPLKGDTSYYDLAATHDRGPLADVAWVYSSPFPFASQLAGHIAFDSSRVSVTIAPG